MFEHQNDDFWGDDFLDNAIASVWACLPEEAADSLATFKKDALKGFRGAVDSFVDTAVANTDRNLENARRKREEWRTECSAEQSSDSPGEAPPNPA